MAVVIGMVVVLGVGVIVVVVPFLKMLLQPHRQ